MEARDILIRPLITERTTQLMAEFSTSKLRKSTRSTYWAKRNAWAARWASVLTIKKLS